MAAARASMRGRRDAPANYPHLSQSPPHGFCKPRQRWVGGMFARAMEFTTHCERKLEIHCAA
eukprot:7690580-Pyramimonas_sp.AAC.1